ncbi:FAD-binding protein [Paenibacillus ginsengihumi]|uniref:FAD-binding protein n=1 Tax=Paenibacillus ginsengihumi TaxID=431596 RepID=UPI000A0721AE|nr:FAD-binding protein [Paenibacillus ginsengihumi]
MARERYDVVIIGSGGAGLRAAYAAAEQGACLAVLTKGELQRRSLGLAAGTEAIGTLAPYAGAHAQPHKPRRRFRSGEAADRLGGAAVASCSAGRALPERRPGWSGRRSGWRRCEGNVEQEGAREASLVYNRYEGKALELREHRSPG